MEGADSEEGRDPLYSVIPDSTPHTYENSQFAGCRGSHYQGLNTANRTNAVYAGLNNSDNSYENAVAQTGV